MESETRFVVVGALALLALLALVGLVAYLMRLRARVHRLEGKATPAEVQARLVAVDNASGEPCA